MKADSNRTETGFMARQKGGPKDHSHRFCDVEVIPLMERTPPRGLTPRRLQTICVSPLPEGR